MIWTWKTQDVIIMSCALGQHWTSIKFKIQLQPMQRLKPENAMHIIINQLGTEDFNTLTWWATLPCLWPLRKVYTSYKAGAPRVGNKIHSGLSGYRMPFLFTRGRITPANLQLWNPNPQGKKERIPYSTTNAWLRAVFTTHRATFLLQRWDLHISFNLQIRFLLLLE
jgi:hypothetical protein